MSGVIKYLVHGRFTASIFLFLVTGRQFSGENKGLPTLICFKECLLLFANNLTAVPDTKDDILFCGAACVS